MKIDKIHVKIGNTFKDPLVEDYIRAMYSGNGLKPPSIVIIGNPLDANRYINPLTMTWVRFDRLPSTHSIEGSSDIHLLRALNSITVSRMERMHADRVISTFPKHTHLGLGNKYLWAWFYREVAVLLKIPKIYRIRTSVHDWIFHNECGPAISFTGGFNFYYLNGIPVPAEIVLKSADKLDPTWMVKTMNVDVRREVIKKIGIARILNHFQAKVIDQWGDYQLLLLTLERISTAGWRRSSRERGSEPFTAKYLKMKNPSIKEWHVEGVPHDVETIQAALSWRIGGILWNPSQLT